MPHAGTTDKQDSALDSLCPVGIWTCKPISYNKVLKVQKQKSVRYKADLGTTLQNHLQVSYISSLFWPTLPIPHPNVYPTHIIHTHTVYTHNPCTHIHTMYTHTQPMYTHPRYTHTPCTHTPMYTHIPCTHTHCVHTHTVYTHTHVHTHTIYSPLAHHRDRVVRFNK